MTNYILVEKSVSDVIEYAESKGYKCDSSSAMVDNNRYLILDEEDKSAYFVTYLNEDEISIRVRIPYDFSRF